MSSNLPLKKFGDVCTFVRGPFGGSLKKNEFRESGYVVYEQQHAIGNQFSSIRYFIDDEKFNDMKRFELFSGDLIMSCSGTMGKVAIVPKGIERGIINQALLKLTPSDDLDVNYLKYWMESNIFQESIAKYSVGAAIKNVASVKILKQIDIPLPPLPEQKQIVKTLDLAFKQIDQAKANLEKNLNNAKELFASKLNEVFSQRGEGWVEKRLGDITTVEYGFTAKSTTEGDFRYIRITDIDKKGNLILNARKYIDDTDEARNFQLKENDILMARTGATFGKVLLYKDYEPSVFASYLIRINFTEDISNELYWYFSKSQFYWSQANTLSSGSAQPHFNGKALKEVIFHIQRKKKSKIKLSMNFKFYLSK